VPGGDSQIPTSARKNPCALKGSPIAAHNAVDETHSNRGAPLIGRRATPAESSHPVPIWANRGGHKMSKVLQRRTIVWLLCSALIASLAAPTSLDAQFIPPNLRPAGELVSWRFFPDLPAGDDFVEVAAGQYYFLVALRSDGSLVAAGNNDRGQLDVPPGNDFVHVAARFGCIAIREDGSLVTWGFNSSSWDELIVPEGRFIAVATNDLTCMAVREDGVVLSWRADQGDIVGDWQFAGHEIKEVALGGAGGFWLGLRTDGTVVGGGSNLEGQLNIPPINDVVGIQASHAVGAALRSDGSMVTWGGSNDGGWLSIAPAGNDIQMMSCGSFHGSVLRTDGSLDSWGPTEANGGIGTGPFSQFPAIPAGNNFIYTSSGGVDTFSIRLTNLSPVADAGQDQTVAATQPGGAVVTLDGSDSIDPDGDGLDFEWSVAAGSGIVLDDSAAAVTSGLFPIGVHQVTLTVYDVDGGGVRKGGVDVASVTIVVHDQTPPTAMVTANFAALWPPNHALRAVTLYVLVGDAVTDPASLLVNCTVASSQPDGASPYAGDVNGQDGFAAPVAVALSYVGGGVYSAVIQLRAERDSGDAAGRVYSIQITALDEAGNLGDASTTVVVPHNQGKK
jgi:hypothetical protein